MAPAAGSAGIQLIAGLAARVIGSIAVVMAATRAGELLTLVALFRVGLTNIVSGSALSGRPELHAVAAPSSVGGHPQGATSGSGAEGCGGRGGTFPPAAGSTLSLPCAGRECRDRPKKTSRSTIGQ